MSICFDLLISESGGHALAREAVSMRGLLERVVPSPTLISAVISPDLI